MRRREQPRPAGEGAEVPEPLRAGVCVEVWAAGDPWPHLEARRNYWEARHRWCWWTLGLDPYAPYDLLPAELLVPTSPWSSASRERKQRLLEHGLPATWRPSPTSPDDFGAPVGEAARYSSVRPSVVC